MRFFGSATRLNLSSPQARGLDLWFPLGFSRVNHAAGRQILSGAPPVQGTPLRPGVYTASAAYSLSGSEIDDVVDDDNFSVSIWARAASNESSDSKAVEWKTADGLFMIDGVGGATPTGLDWRVAFDAENQVARSTTSPFDGEWHLFTGVYEKDSNEIRLYVDGGIVATTSTSYTFGDISGGTLYIGYSTDGGARRWQGHLADFRLYRRALSDEDVVALWDPATRWQLYQPASPFIPSATPAPAFEPAWALNSKVII